MAAIGLLYAASVIWGRTLMMAPGGVSGVWPRAGVALAFFLIAGPRIWPVLWLSQFAAEWIYRADTTSLQASLLLLSTFAATTTGSTFAAWAGATAVRRFADPAGLFKSFSSALRFLLFGGLLSSACAATLGVLWLALGHWVPWTRFAYTWLTWWWGNVVGVVVFAPLVLVWHDHLSSAAGRARLRRLLAPTNLAIVGLCVGATYGVFSFATVVFPFLLVPFFIVVIYRLADLGVATTVPLMVLIVGWSTAHGSGPFANLPRDVAQLHLGAFYVTIAVTGLLSSAMLTSRQVAEDAVRSNQRLLQAIVDNSPANIHVKDADGRYLLVNRRCETVLGRSRAEILGKRDAELFSTEVADALGAHDREVWRGGMAVEREETLVHRGEPRIYSCYKVPLVDEQGVPYALCGISTDITEGRAASAKLEKSVSLLQATIGSTADGLLVIDCDGSVVAVNRKFQELWGISDGVLATGSDEVLLGHVVSIVKDSGAFMAKIQQLYAQPAATSFDLIELVDGRIFERYSQPERVGDRICGRVWSFRDVTERRRAENGLRRSEARFRRVAESNMIGIIFCDLSGGITEANDYFLGTVGYGREDLLAGALRWTDLTPPEYRHIDENAIGALTTTGVAHLFEKEYIRKDGTRVPVLLAAATLYGSQTEIVAVVLDISAQRRAEQARDRLFLREQQARAQAEDATRQAAFLAQISSILAESLDYETTLAKIARLALPTLADACLVDLLVGQELRQVAAAHVDAAKEPLLAELRIRALRECDPQLPPIVALRTGQPYLISVLTDEALVALDSDLRRVEVIRALEVRSLLKIPMRVRGRCIGLLTLQSRTPGRYSSTDLPLAQQLADRCAIAIENAQLYADAQKSIQVRDDFIAIASHELRTPLTPLKMQLDMLRNQLLNDAVVPSSKSDRLVALLASSHGQMNRLSRLVENLLDVSRLSADRLELNLEELDLSQVARDVAEQLSSELARASCVIRVVAAASVVGRWDRLRIDQVVTNLLTNAVKFGRGKPIDLRVSVEGCRARLAVQDHGVGVAEEDRSRIFDRFERAASIKRFEGMGLGLFITRQIVLAHGGTIRVESELNAGATFIVELPLTPDERAPLTNLAKCPG